MRLGCGWARPLAWRHGRFTAAWIAGMDSWHALRCAQGGGGRCENVARWSRGNSCSPSHWLDTWTGATVLVHYKLLGVSAHSAHALY